MFWQKDMLQYFFSASLALIFVNTTVVSYRKNNMYTSVVDSHIELIAHAQRRKREYKTVSLVEHLSAYRFGKGANIIQYHWYYLCLYYWGDCRESAMICHPF